MKISAIYPGYPVNAAPAARQTKPEENIYEPQAVKDKLAQLLAEKRGENEAAIEGRDSYLHELGNNIDLRV